MVVKEKKIGEELEVILNNRGASGLTMKYIVDNDDVISISGPEFVKTENLMPGDSTKIIFKILTLKTGMVKISFFETQVWNKNFKPINVLELNINVIE